MSLASSNTSILMGAEVIHKNNWVGVIKAISRDEIDVFVSWTEPEDMLDCWVSREELDFLMDDIETGSLDGEV